MPASLTEQATVPGFPETRLWLDGDLAPFVRVAASDFARERMALRRQGLSVDPMPPMNFLAISGGGDKGAFAAALLEHVPDWRAAVLGAVRALAGGGVLLLTTTNRHHPFQGEVNHFPFYPWVPSAVRDRVLAWIMKHRRHLVNYTDFPAVHWFSYPQLKGELRRLGLEVYDRLDLMRREQLTGARSLARWMVPRSGRAARGRILFYLLSPTVALYARRPGDPGSG